MKRIRALTEYGRRARSGLISMEIEMFGVRRFWIPPKGDHRYWMALAQLPELAMKSAEIGSIAGCSMFINGKKL